MSIYSTTAFTSSYYNNTQPQNPHWSDAIIIIPISSNPDLVKSYCSATIDYAKSIGKEDRLVIYSATSPTYNKEIRPLLESNKSLVITGGSYHSLTEIKVRSISNLALGKTGTVASLDATMYDKDSYNVAIICLDRLEDCDKLVPGIKDEFEGRNWLGAKKDNHLFGVDVFLHHPEDKKLT